VFQLLKLALLLPKVHGDVKELEGACAGGHMYRGPGTTLGSNWALALGSAINHLQPGVCHTGGSQGAPAVYIQLQNEMR
jgi:hypothetical protein